MNVGAVRGSAQTTGQQNPQLKAIDKQIREAQKQLAETRANKSLDAQQKKQKIQQYQEQITQLEQQKMQIQAEARKAKTEQSAANQQKQPEKQAENGGAAAAAFSSQTQNALIQLDSAAQTKRQLGAVRTDIENQLRIAESTSFLRTPDPEAAAELRQKLGKIDETIMSKVRPALDALQNEPSQKAGNDDRQQEEEPLEAEKKNSGTGRMEAGQFLNEEA